ncbi:MAG: AsmA-like C-terminal region-containing protein [Pseudomonadota bacterium]
MADRPDAKTAVAAAPSLGPYLIRPLFVIATIIVVVTAIGQFGGRLLFANLERLEASINERLAPRSMELIGLRGDWRFFNPIVTAREVRAPGVALHDVRVELDIIESLARNRITLAAGDITSAQAVVVEVSPGTWRLAGSEPGELDFDWRNFLWQSDRLEVALELTVQALDARPSVLSVEGSLRNFGGRHRGRVRLAAVPAGSATCTNCGLAAEYAIDEVVPWLRERSGRASLAVDNLRLDDSIARLLRVDGLVIGDLDAELRLDVDRLHGPLHLRDSWVRLPGGARTSIAAEAQGWLIDDGSSARVGVSGLALAAGETRLVLSDVLANYDRGEGLALTLPGFSAEALTGLVNSMLPADSKAVLWAQRLNLRGRFEDVYASFRGQRGLGYRAAFNDVYVKNFRGIPAMERISGTLEGGQGFLHMDLASVDTDVTFPELFRDTRHYESMTGELLMVFQPDYYGLRGTELDFREADMGFTGGFSLMSTQPEGENQMLLDLASDVPRYAILSAYVPTTLPADLLDWLGQAGLESDLGGLRLTMHGPLREELSTMVRSYRLRANLDAADLQYHPDWPRLENGRGQLLMSHERLRGWFDSASVSELRLAEASLAMPTGGSLIDLAGNMSFDMGAGLDFIRGTPLADSLDFIEPDWRGAGPVRFAAEMRLPIGERARAAAELDPNIRVTLRGELGGVDLALPETGLEFSSLIGPLRYAYPYEVTSRGLAGKLFDSPVDIRVTSTSLAERTATPEFAHCDIRFDLFGEMPTNDLWRLLEIDGDPVASGIFDYDARYTVSTRPDVVPTLVADTDLGGVTVTLPAPLGKGPSAPNPSRVAVRFGETDQLVRLEYGESVNAHFVTRDGSIAGGNLRLGGGAADGWQGEPLPVRVDGSLPSADVVEWSGGDGNSALPPYAIDAVEVAEVRIGDTVIPDVRLTGTSDAQRFELAFESDRARGRLTSEGDAVPLLSLAYFNYITPPGEDDSEADPITPEMMDQLQDLRVDASRIEIDGENYGAWALEIERTAEGVAFRDLAGEIKHLQLVSAEGFSWRRADNRTLFNGDVAATDLGDVLEAWDYPRSVESKQMLTEAHLSWPGSPLNFDLLASSGQASFEVNEGRFLDVGTGGGTGALRLVSLMNLSAVTKRMSFDFKDVFGRGIAFDELSSSVRLDEGVIDFVEPLHLDGTSGDFKVNGRVDMVAGVLDNEMVVTLPVNKSLPWLGAYLAIANPLVGIGVLVGERILRKPIEGLSSAKYQIGGSFEAPELALVGVFDDRLQEYQAPPENVPEVPADIDLLDGEPEPDDEPSVPGGAVGELGAVGGVDGDVDADASDEASDEQVAPVGRSDGDPSGDR